MNKVMLIGNGGKNNARHRMAARYDLPLSESDALQLQPGPAHTDEAALRQAIAAVAPPSDGSSTASACGIRGAHTRRNAMNLATIYNERKVDDELITGGQPTEEQLQAAAREGVRTIINLAPSDTRSALPDEASAVQALGMSYHHIPVDWENPTEQDFASFEQVMQMRAAGKTLIHCAANFRVTAFFSLYARKHLGWSPTQAASFRASVWEGSHYPIWDAFIAHMNARIDEADANRVGA
jgi:uncharacterized protein (TIGR01244 family)